MQTLGGCRWGRAPWHWAPIQLSLGSCPCVAARVAPVLSVGSHLYSRTASSLHPLHLVPPMFSFHRILRRKTSDITPWTPDPSGRLPCRFVAEFLESRLHGDNPSLSLPLAHSHMPWRQLDVPSCLLDPPLARSHCPPLCSGSPVCQRHPLTSIVVHTSLSSWSPPEGASERLRQVLPLPIS